MAASSEISIPNSQTSHPLCVGEKAAARMLGLSQRTLARMRLEGMGPKYIRLSRRRVAYQIADLQEHMERRKFSSTSHEELAKKASKVEDLNESHT